MSTANQPSNSVLDRVHSLRKKLAGLSTLEAVDDRGMTTGCKSLDRLLPGGSLRTGVLIEFLADGCGSGAGALAMQIAKQAIGETRGYLVVTDRWRRFYPPAAVARGIETKDLIVVRSSDATVMSSAEELWALDQALRCPGVGVVLAWIDKIESLSFRRLQLAAETGQTLALLLRPTCVLSQPTWSDVQLMVRPSGGGQGKTEVVSTTNENRCCQVTLLRQRGRAGSNTLEGTSVELEIDEQLSTLKAVHRRHETRTMHMAPRVAHSATRRRSAGA